MADAAPLTASMPQFTVLGNNGYIALEAVDPTTGDAITGVVFSQVDIWADVEATEPALDVQPPLLAHDPAPQSPGTNA